MLETVIGYDPKFEQDLSFMNIFREVTSKNGIGELILLSKQELRLLRHQSECLSPALSDLEIAEIYYLQFYLKIFKKMGLTQSIAILNNVPLKVKCFRTSGEETKAI